MANKHFGNLADVFKHLALGEMITLVVPAEYWESHAGSAYYDENAVVEGGLPPTEERLHGAHFFAREAGKSAILRPSLYYRVLSKELGNGEVPLLKRVAGSPALANELLKGNPRRLLFCDFDAQSLTSIRSLGGDERIVECVQEDGVSVLRGAAMCLPEPWPASTLALIDPYVIDVATDSQITPLELWCEMASRGIKAVLWYGFGNAEERLARHGKMKAALEKARLANKGVQRFEGALKAPSVPTPATLWGFGLLTAHLPGAALERVDQVLKELEAIYQEAKLGEGTGAWTYTRAWM